MNVPLEEVHVWTVSLPASLPEGVLPLLSAPERARMARFLAERKRVEFACSRYALREILADCLDTTGAAVPITVEALGKPQLPPALLERCGLHFNVSHCAAAALIAVARDRAVGVDIEVMKPERPLDTLARRFFAPAEAATLQGLPEPLRLRGFYRCWTAKEAYVKALGKGLHLPLDRFAVEADPRKPLRLMAGGAPGERWSFLDLAVGPDLCGVCVVAGQGVTLKQRDFPWAGLRGPASGAERA